jgi:multiple sugar transport system substrate-binding protein
MQAMRSLVDQCSADVFQLTPITMMDPMSRTDEIIYCPLAYGYSNYSRSGFQPNLCLYTDMPGLRPEPRDRIGGTGLAISASWHPAELRTMPHRSQKSLPADSLLRQRRAAGCAYRRMGRRPALRHVAAGFLPAPAAPSSSVSSPDLQRLHPIQYEGGRMIHECLKQRRRGDPAA